MLAFAIDYDQVTEDSVREFGAVPVSYNLNRTGTNPLQDLMATVELARLFRRHRVDTVFCYFLKPVIYGSWAAILAGVRHRYSLLPGLGIVFSADQRERTLYWKFVQAIVSVQLRVALYFSHRLFLYNVDDKRVIESLRGTDSGKIVLVAGTGVDLTLYMPTPPVVEPITFLMVARLLVQKGVRDFVEAAKVVKENHPAVQFVLVGGTDSNPLSVSVDEVRSWVDQGIVEWPGHVNDVRPWLETASVFVLPSYYREGVPRSSQEALAAALPVITTDSVGCRETVDDGRNGYLVPPRQPKVLAACMERFVNEPGLISRMGEESRRLAERRFDVNVINDTLVEAMGIASLTP